MPEVPRTLSGKKQELPIKKLLLGQPIEKVVNKDAMANPASPRLVCCLRREIPSVITRHEKSQDQSPCPQGSKTPRPSAKAKHR